MNSPISIAANLANRAHAADSQMRKGTGLPYIIHPYRVALLVEASGGTQEQIAAAWAHDVLEDCPRFHEEAKAVLPPAVYALVNELTKQEVSPGKRVKGEAFMAEIRAMSPTAKLVKLCDRLDNLRDVISANKPAWARSYAAESVEVLAALTGTDPATGEHADRLVAKIREQITAVQEWAVGQP